MPDIAEINDLAIANIAKFKGATLDAGDKVIGISKAGSTTTVLSVYDFNDQTTNENGASDWIPSGTHSGWATDTSVVTGAGSFGNPASNSNTTTDGWNSGYGTTPSSNTGPSGGLHADLDGSHDATKKYMYIEGTGVKDDRVCVVRSPGMNYSTTMNDQTNDLNLTFWVHQYSAASTGHNLYVYIDDASTSTEADATLLESTTSFTAGDNGFWSQSNGGHSANWVKHTISLNSYRAVNATHYIYFVADGATSYQCDICIDSVQIEENG